jgi:predicted helicase
MLTISPHNKAIERYYRDLERYRVHGAIHEMATRTAFQGLLATLADEVGWALIPELRLDNGRRPDGTLRDGTFTRGFWEAKDTGDDLVNEVQRKITAGYPTTNIIFEDTQHGILYQTGREVLRADLRTPSQLAELLTEFFRYSRPEFDNFGTAETEFRERIPALARAMQDRIQRERKAHRDVEAAFQQFAELCRTSVNLRISDAEVEEMLVQHLLSERLFATVFQNRDFVQRNTIAREIEKVIAVLTGHSFDRAEFLAPIDRFYVAIEEAARHMVDWTEKQHFLNAVYERFFQGYSTRQADTHGIVYTPQQIVAFMVASVEHILQEVFGRSLGDEEVKVLDPCTGTGNFVVSLIDATPIDNLEQKYHHGLFANEIMLLPYYVAALNIEHRYYAKMEDYQTFPGLCFADTLKLEGQQMTIASMSEENAVRVGEEEQTPIMVVIGNPPYNVGQESENDNNKNRRYPEVERRVRETYAKASTATNKNALSDAYVKFFRWATDRLRGRDGIVCFVTNDSFVDQIAFDGMRRHLLEDFSQIYHLDLHGNVRKNPKLSGTTHNVFGIQVGVGITVAVRASEDHGRFVRYYRVPEEWRKEEKLAFLAERGSIASIDWQELEPDEQATWLTEGLRPEFASFLPLGTKAAKALAGSTVDVPAIFANYGRGVATTRDTWAYDFDRAALVAKINRMIETFNGEVDRWKRRGGSAASADDFVTYDDRRIKWSRDLKVDLQRGHYAEFAESKVRHTLYRPFCRQWLFFDRILNEEVYQFPQFFPTPATEAENSVLVVSDHGYRSGFGVLAANVIPDLHLIAATDAFQCFPLYSYAEDGSHRQENVTDWALRQFRSQHGDGVTKLDIFHYVYGLLHHSEYRSRYAKNLKRELARIPVLPDRAAFEMCVRIGAELALLHIGYEQGQEYSLHRVRAAGVRPSWRVEKMRLTPDRSAVVVNESLRLEGIPAECFEYRLGNRSALEWVVDQYQVSTDKRSGIASDPNRADDHEYIARLVARVVQVSVETVRLVHELEQAVSLDSVTAGAVAGRADP